MVRQCTLPLIFFARDFQNIGTNSICRKRVVLEECVANGNFSSLVSQEVGRIPDIIHRYCGEDGGSMRLSVGDRIGLHLSQHLLFKMMQQDKKSHEFVCFGYHVAARKV